MNEHLQTETNTHSSGITATRVITLEQHDLSRFWMTVAGQKGLTVTQHGEPQHRSGSQSENPLEHFVSRVTMVVRGPVGIVSGL